MDCGDWSKTTMPMRQLVGREDKHVPILVAFRVHRWGRKLGRSRSAVGAHQDSRPKSW